MSGYSNQGANDKIKNQFELVLVAAQRARELRKGAKPKVNCKNGPAVTALKEIEAGLHTKEDFLKTIKPKRTDR